ncbi:unnamed protein product [Parnassius apollo]|uniref:(apollo) hypothetical protein n=1 Tax=Parnassius apollo TaxID=110799 RepID=A0A8S3W279_PARAO|nr:unnamed protein product [Parnassius apollo]
MAAKDGLSFNFFASSQEIKKGLAARIFEKIPSSPNIIRSMVFQYERKVREELIAELNKRKAEDIVDVTSDGASVMKKLGKLISAEQQPCFAHAIHLAVLDVMYKKKSKQPEERNVSENNNEDNNEDNSEDNSADNSENESGYESEDEN